MEYENTFIQYAIEYDNPNSPFAESPTRMRFFAQRQELDKFIEEMSPEERVLSAFRQETHITKEYFIGQK